jgi:hypothetical protein
MTVTDGGAVITNAQSTGSAVVAEATAVAYGTGNILAASVSSSTECFCCTVWRFFWLLFVPMPYTPLLGHRASHGQDKVDCSRDAWVCVLGRGGVDVSRLSESGYEPHLTAIWID